MENIDGKTYTIIRQIYENTCLQLNNLITDWFAVNSGVRQGDNLSPTLFAFLINSLAKVINDLGKGICVGNDNVNILLYADDMVLLSTNENDLQKVLKAMCEWSKQWRLKVNAEKTKLVHFRPKRKHVTSFNFVYDGNNIERVSEYKYLGVYLDEFLKYDKCATMTSIQIKHEENIK